MFLLERMLVRGAHYRLLLIIALLGLLSVLGGGFVQVTRGGFENAWEAFWWAFLRLSDPGYLGDDTGILRRIVSTLLTVAGYVLFLGALVATMTQWLNATLARLELGLTPVRMVGHIAILGWTDRSAELIREIILSERTIRDRLRLRGVSRLRLAVLTERVGPTLIQELRDELGGSFSASQIVLRSGSALRVEHLERVDVRHASAVVVPGGDYTPIGVASQDARIMKILLTVNAIVRDSDEPPPTFVGELYDQRTVPAVHDAYPGRIELVATEGLVGRMLASGVLQPGLTSVHQRLLTHSDANSLYVCDEHELAGASWFEASRAFERAVLIGRIRRQGTRDVVQLNPPVDVCVQADDRLVVVAHTENDTVPEARPRLEPPAPREVDLLVPSLGHLLVLGWNRKAPAMLAELERHVPHCRVCILSPLPEERRLRDTSADGVRLQRLHVEHRVGDYIDPGLLEQVEPRGFDRIVLLASESVSNREEADARAIAAYLLLAEYFETHRCTPDILVELTDPDDASLLQRYPVQVLSSPRLVSHILAQVVLRRELHLVLLDLLGGGGADLRLVPAYCYGLEGTLEYGAIDAIVRAAGHTPLGLRPVATGEVLLNPPRDESFVLQSEDGIIVVA